MFIILESEIYNVIGEGKRVHQNWNLRKPV